VILADCNAGLIYLKYNGGVYGSRTGYNCDQTKQNKLPVAFGFIKCGYPLQT